MSNSKKVAETENLCASPTEVEQPRQAAGVVEFDLKKSAEDVEKQIEQVGTVQPPDGGYGWIIVLSSFALNYIVDGTLSTVGGIFLQAWPTEFQISEASASLAMSLLTSFYFFIGPFASAFANVFGCRNVAIAGCVIASIGFLASTVAPSIYFLYVSFGIIGGAGFGMMYLPAIVIISQYFSSKRSLATGIAVCGSGIGTTVFSLANGFVYTLAGDEWRKFLLYISTLALSGVAAALLLKPLKASKEQLEKVTILFEEYGENKETEEKPARVGATPRLAALEEHVQVAQQSDSAATVQDIVAHDVELLNRPLARRDVYYIGSTDNLAARSRSNTLTKTDAEIGAPSKMSIGAELRQSLASLLDRSLLASPSFLVLAFSGTLTLTCFYVPYIYLANHLEKIPGLTKTQKALPISLIGVVNIMARIVCGYIADQPQVSALVVNNIALTAAGVATALVPFFTEYWHFLAFCVPFAIGVACFAALRSVMVVELFGVDKLSNAFGILMTFMGVGAIIGSPLAAFIKDQTGSFDPSFYVAGTLMALSGLICLPLSHIRRWEDERIRVTDARNNVELEGLTASE